MFKIGDTVRVIDILGSPYREESREYYLNKTGKVTKAWEAACKVNIPSYSDSFQDTYWLNTELELVMDADKESLRDLLLDARSWLLSAANLVYYEEDETNDIDELYSRMDLMGERIEEAICVIEIVLENWRE